MGAERKRLTCGLHLCEGVDVSEGSGGVIEHADSGAAAGCVHTTHTQRPLNGSSSRRPPPPSLAGTQPDGVVIMAESNTQLFSYCQISKNRSMDNHRFHCHSDLHRQ